MKEVRGQREEEVEEGALLRSLFIEGEKERGPKEVTGSGKKGRRLGRWIGRF